MASLLHIISQLQTLQDDDVIVAKTEWRCDSEAAVFKLTHDCRVPSQADAAGYKYFLEVTVAREVLAEFEGRPDVTSDQKCNRLIHYATYDA